MSLEIKPITPCNNCGGTNVVRQKGSNDIACSKCGEVLARYITGYPADEQPMRVTITTTKVSDDCTVSVEVAKRESILLEAERIVNGDRNTDYGDSSENLRRICEIAKAIGVNISSVDFCKVMIAAKLARHMNRSKRDNLTDCCGYLELMAREENL